MGASFSEKPQYIAIPRPQLCLDAFYCFTCFLEAFITSKNSAFLDFNPLEPRGTFIELTRYPATEGLSAVKQRKFSHVVFAISLLFQTSRSLGVRVFILAQLVIFTTDFLSRNAPSPPSSLPPHFLRRQPSKFAFAFVFHFSFHFTHKRDSVRCARQGILFCLFIQRLSSRRKKSHHSIWTCHYFVTSSIITYFKGIGRGTK